MSDETSKQPDENRSYEDERNNPEGIRMADPLDLVYRGGAAGNPREIIENPAVVPQMVNTGQMGEADADDLRDDMISGDDGIDGN